MRQGQRDHTPSRRTQIVWGAFVTATTVVMALLGLGGVDVASGFPLTSIHGIGQAPLGEGGGCYTNLPIPPDRWTGIVIHHLAEPAGTAESVHRRHVQWGYEGLGYHFLIGNGNGLGDGVVHVGYRWSEQRPGAHVAGSVGSHHNQRFIGICLVGNGDRRPFTDRQMTHLIRLVQRLQQELEIPRQRVLLHREIGDATTSPGRFFATARFTEHLLDLPD